MRVIAHSRTPKEGSLLAQADVISLHMAWAPMESRQRLMDCVVKNLAAFLEGRPQNVVN